MDTGGLFFTEALFNIYTPPPEADLTEEDVMQLNQAVIWQRMMVPRPTPEQLVARNKDSNEHYAVWHLYASW